MKVTTIFAITQQIRGKIRFLSHLLSAFFSSSCAEETQLDGNVFECVFVFVRIRESQ